jgi:hypothetical protein
MKMRQENHQSRSYDIPQRGSFDPCDTTHLVMTPLPEWQLREVVILSIQAEDLKKMVSRD